MKLKWKRIDFFKSLTYTCEVVSKSFRTGRLERECSCIVILLVSLVSIVAITLWAASQRMFVISIYFFINSVRKLLDTPSYCFTFISRNAEWM